MPIIILGIIVVGGALFLVLSHFKPKIGGRRLRGGYNGFGFGGFDGLGAMQDGNNSFKMPFEDMMQPPAEEGGEAQGTPGATTTERSEDGKVLYVFGSGEREERSLGEDDKQDE